MNPHLSPRVPGDDTSSQPPAPPPPVLGQQVGHTEQRESVFHLPGGRKECHLPAALAAPSEELQEPWGFDPVPGALCILD